LKTGTRPTVRYDQVAALYHEGRRPLAQLLTWGQLIELPQTDQFRVLDLGAGTGIFIRAWRDWGASSVVGVDPSLAMLQEAQRFGLPLGAQLLVGRAEQLPLASGTFDAAWLSAMIHHVTDRDACARELARVLRPEGHVYLRGFFAGASRLGWLPYFPGADRAIARFPSIEDVEEVFARAGFSLLAADAVPEPPRPAEEVRAWIVKMRHSDTLLIAMSDDEFDAGLAAIDESSAISFDGTLHLVTLAR
jgi:SAM-dependent methyltransferase